MMKFYWTEKEASFEAFYWTEGASIELFRCGDCIIFEDGRMLWRQWLFDEDENGCFHNRTPYRIGRLDDKNCNDWDFHLDPNAPRRYFNALKMKEVANVNIDGC